MQVPSAPAAVLEPPSGPPSGRRSQPAGRPAPPALAAASGAVAVMALLPALYLVVRAAGGDPAAVVRQALDSRTLALLARSCGLAAAVTASSTLIAVPAAWLTVRTDLPGRRTWAVLTALPLVIPSYVGGYAFVAAFGPRGVAQQWLSGLGVERLPSIYGFAGAWGVLTLFTYPYVLMTVRSAMRGLDPSVEEAARSLGRRSFIRVTLPQLRPAIASGALLVALYALHDFGAVSLLRFDSFTRVIYQQYQSSFDRRSAAILSLVLVAVTLAVVTAEGRTRTRARYYRAHSGAARRAPVTALGRWRWPAFAACGLLVLAALVVPVGIVGYWFVRGMASGESAGFTLGAAAGSLQASALGAVAALVAAWPVALLSARHPGRFAGVVERSSFVGYALPGVVVALSLVFLGTRLVPALYQTRAMLTFAYVVLFLPQAVGALRASLLQVPPEVEDAARSLGSSPMTVMRRVVAPMVRPGALTALALVFLTVMKELPATLLLSPIGFQTLATRVWGATSEAFFARAAAPALALVALSSAPLAYLVFRESRRR
ncbi:MAG TPA: iron ABC transporter permease [Actinomycetota bacterium]|nr:iron ABC transporter permease [Actinomycetota bacterium]